MNELNLPCPLKRPDYKNLTNLVDRCCSIECWYVRSDFNTSPPPRCVLMVAGMLAAKEKRVKE